MRTTKIDEKEKMIDWARNSRPGDMAIYYEYTISRSARRMLCSMRQYNKELHEVARMAWGLHEQEIVNLVQMRLNDTNYYCAVKRDPKRIRRNVRS